MALVEIKNIRMRGVAAGVPTKKVTTASYDALSAEECDLFIKTTGISERRVAPDHISTSDLCIPPARELLTQLNWTPEEVDVIIMVTQSPDHFIPCSAVIAQNRLGLRKDIPAFDINLGCSGYVYGLYVLSSLLTGGQLKKGLLLAGDKSTSSTAYTDKSTYPLFGDAGSATALEFSDGASSLFFQLSSDGSGKDVIMVEDGGSRNGLKEDTFEMKEIQPGIVRSKRHLKLDGIEIFNFALREVAPSLTALFSFAQHSIESTDFFVFHQANKLINESVRKKLKISALEKVPYSLENFGNTSSASIPLTLVTQISYPLNNSAVNLCLSGFGVGFSWAGCILKTDKISCPPLLEIV